MTKEVWVSICGTHFTDEEQDPIKIIVPGEYYYRNGKHYILYEEAVEGSSEKIKNRIKISDNQVELTKKGAGDVHMAFQPGVKNLTSFPTPFGHLMMGMQTHTVQIEKEEDSLNVRMEYDLEVEDADLSCCLLTIEVCSRNGENFPGLAV